MSVTKPIISMGLLLLLAACAEPAGNRHASADSREILRPKTVHSPYIATSGRGGDSRRSYPQPGEFRTYGIVDAAPPPIASGPSRPIYAPSEVSPTGAHRTVINQVTNEPVIPGAPAP